MFFLSYEILIKMIKFHLCSYKIFIGNNIPGSTSLKMHSLRSKSKEEGKDQESIQSSITTDPRHNMGKCQKHKETSHTREPRGHRFPSR